MSQPAILIIVFLAVSLVVIVARAIILECINQRNTRQDAASVRPATPPTTKSIFSGTTPHEMTGEVALVLQENIQLPDSGWTEIEPPDGLIDKVIQAAQAVRTFSALSFQSTATEGVLQSWRIDCTKPDEAHVSQAIRDGEGYALDEWVSLHNQLFINTGIWFDIQDHSQIEERTTFNQYFMPENVVSELSDQHIEYVGRATIHENAYLFLQTSLIQSDPNTSVRLQLWLDAHTLFIQKRRLIVYENEQISAEDMTAYTQPQDSCSISAPDWINVNDGVITNTSVCIVEHW
ncbi:hypothetical protein [Vibrio mangrovi]|uniref:Uncharacterized protein n=1 Tax=Vibrio mangrovi TaxID=474394 RepID=A0A1Y6J1A7_9VIBR|nr:hypothetical protein [Vibrio mangrovi]MDW6005465.1 hypothetical protein [Vibrio mangrovi]SMS02093.1 hypothetical protein VIM7927_03407 [Vibrio mangrovi]